MVAHPTPFLTGRPFTMFYNGNILSSGAVGLCIRPSTNYTASVSVKFPDLSPVTPVLTVTEYVASISLLIPNLCKFPTAQRVTSYIPSMTPTLPDCYWLPYRSSRPLRRTIHTMLVSNLPARKLWDHPRTNYSASCLATRLGEPSRSRARPHPRQGQEYG